MQFVCSIVANALICETEGSSASCTVKDLEKLSKMCNRQDQTIWSASSVLQSKISSAVIQIKYCLTAATLCSVAGVSIGLRGEEKKINLTAGKLNAGEKKSTFVRSPSIFYYDFCVIPPQHSYKSQAAAICRDSDSAGGAPKPTLKCSINIFFFLFALGGVLRATFVHSELWKFFILFVFSSFLTAHLFFYIVCSGRECSKMSCDAQRAVVLLSHKLVLWST